MNKKGLSMISMLVYVVLFFSFSAFAVGMGTNMNYRTLTEKGKIINAENVQKLQNNLLNSARNSTSVENISGKLVFSNNDEYTFNETEKKIYKNGGVIITDVEGFNVTNLNKLENEPSVYGLQPTFVREFVTIEVTFNKYNQEFRQELFISVGDGI